MTDPHPGAGAPAQTHAYILLDRTGSMGSIWTEALGSVNAYAEALTQPAGGARPSGNDKITLAVFDHHDGLKFDVLRRGVTAATWNKVTDAEASPRGMTPLFDSIARIVALAEGDAPQRAVIVIMTDGEENASKEVTKDGARAALDRARAKGWEVVFLGAEFGKFADADAVGVIRSKSMAVSAGSMELSMRKLASKSRKYFEAAETMEFNEEDRKESGEDDVKRRKGK
ncbi:MAG: VWA domain-containing protein [Hyphomonas sp.]|uniref:vWA domain-containing protein n=1 Tax=Hyphomonas sp. TaxID=87 RepID=UPI00182DBA93|nr:vWA domain-containing protein [Hyphomonas sp.]MBA3070360.1 VWA domain-containing protein [Hyphomonas sp.]MBU4062847.1 VWA domain-containing protein [Alphaproteobacteria bacterium]MBU4163766.1 VWA domain-containing protein [Alphaproteobacteria bacterium]MBU4567583.1 VWA domain-containing protein [Alphaproteobacteria bacterium]